MAENRKKVSAEAETPAESMHLAPRLVGVVGGVVAGLVTFFLALGLVASPAEATITSGGSPGAPAPIVLLAHHSMAWHERS